MDRLHFGGKRAGVVTFGHCEALVSPCQLLVGYMIFQSLLDLPDLLVWHLADMYDSPVGQELNCPVAHVLGGMALGMTYALVVLVGTSFAIVQFVGNSFVVATVVGVGCCCIVAPVVIPDC